METQFILLLMLAHYIGDFTLQSFNMGMDKSHKMIELFKHTGYYSISMSGVIFGWIYLMVSDVSGSETLLLNSIIFIVLNFVLHLGTDFFINNVNVSNFEEKNYVKFTTNFALDQIIHIITLLITFNELILKIL